MCPALAQSKDDITPVRGLIGLPACLCSSAKGWWTQRVCSNIKMLAWNWQWEKGKKGPRVYSVHSWHTLCRMHPPTLPLLHPSLPPTPPPPPPGRPAQSIPIGSITIWNEFQVCGNWWIRGSPEGPVLETLQVGPNSLFARLTEGVRSGIKRLKNRGFWPSAPGKTRGADKAFTRS